MAKSPAALVAATIVSLAHASSAPFELIDAHGKKAGRVLTQTVVQIKVASNAYLVEVVAATDVQDHVVPGVDVLIDLLFFATRDCTGQAYGRFFGALNGAASATAYQSGSGRLMLYPNGAVTVMDVRSWLDASGRCTGFSHRGEYTTLGTPVDITTLYARPFHFR